MAADSRKQMCRHLNLCVKSQLLCSSHTIVSDSTHTHTYECETGTLTPDLAGSEGHGGIVTKLPSNKHTFYLHAHDLNVCMVHIFTGDDRCWFLEQEVSSYGGIKEHNGGQKDLVRARKRKWLLRKRFVHRGISKVSLEMVGFYRSF